MQLIMKLYNSGLVGATIVKMDGTEMPLNLGKPLTSAEEAEVRLFFNKAVQATPTTALEREIIAKLNA